jgi:hypothetical protein
MNAKETRTDRTHEIERMLDWAAWYRREADKARGIEMKAAWLGQAARFQKLAEQLAAMSN